MQRRSVVHTLSAQSDWNSCIRVSLVPWYREVEGCRCFQEKVILLSCGLGVWSAASEGAGLGAGWFWDAVYEMPLEMVYSLYFHPLAPTTKSSFLVYDNGMKCIVVTLHTSFTFSILHVIVHVVICICNAMQDHAQEYCD